MMIPQQKQKQKGFTMVELLITMGILAVLAAFATPALVKTMRQTQFNSEVRVVVDSFQQARAEAVIQKRARTVTPATDLKYGNITPTRGVEYDYMGRANINGANTDHGHCFSITHRQDPSISAAILVRPVGNPEIFKNRTNCQ